MSRIKLSYFKIIKTQLPVAFTHLLIFLYLKKTAINMRGKEGIILINFYDWNNNNFINQLTNTITKGMDDINMGALAGAKFSIRKGGLSSKRSDVMSAMCESEATIEVNLETERSASTLTSGRNSNSSSCIETRTASSSGGSGKSATTASSSMEIRTASASPCPVPSTLPIVAQHQKPNSSLAAILSSVSPTMSVRSISVRSPSHRSEPPQPQPQPQHRPYVRIAAHEQTPQHPNIIQTHTLHLDGSASTPLPVGRNVNKLGSGNLFNGLGVFDYDSSEETIGDDSSRDASRSASARLESPPLYSEMGSPPPPRRSASSRRSLSSKAVSSAVGRSAELMEVEQQQRQLVSDRKPIRSISAGTSRSNGTSRRKMFFGTAERQWQVAREREWIEPKRIRPRGVVPDARNETVAKRVYGKVAEEEDNELLENFHNQNYEEDLNVDDIVSRLHPNKIIIERKKRELEELYRPEPVNQPRNVKVNISRLARPPRREVTNYAGFENTMENTFKPKITPHFVTDNTNYGKMMGPVWQRLTKSKLKDRS